MVHELGLERRETVWSLSAVEFEKKKNPNFSTRGLRRINQWFIDYLIALSRSIS